VSNFHFLFEEFSALGRAAQEAERQVYFSPTASCAFSRKALEMALRWMIQHDPELEISEDSSLYLLLTGGDLARFLSTTRCRELDVVRRLGNKGLHEDWLDERQAKKSLQYVHGFLVWLYESYTLDEEYDLPIAPFRVGNIPNYSSQVEALSDGLSNSGVHKVVNALPSHSEQRVIYLTAAEQRVIQGEERENDEQKLSAREQRVDLDRWTSRHGEQGRQSVRFSKSNRGSLLATIRSLFTGILDRLHGWWEDRKISAEIESEMRVSESALDLSVERLEKDLSDYSFSIDEPSLLDGEGGGLYHAFLPVEALVYRRKEGVYASRTPGVSEATTQKMFIETLLREAGWGERMDAQVHLRNRLGGDWGLSPLWASALFTDDLVPELILVDAAKANSGESQIDVVKRALGYRDSPFMVDGLVNYDGATVSVYLVDGVALKHYDAKQDLLVAVDKLHYRK
jgi:hypothetical protein